MGQSLTDNNAEINWLRVLAAVEFIHLCLLLDGGLFSIVLSPFPTVPQDQVCASSVSCEMADVAVGFVTGWPGDAWQVS